MSYGIMNMVGVRGFKKFLKATTISMLRPDDKVLLASDLFAAFGKVITVGSTGGGMMRVQLDTGAAQSSWHGSAPAWLVDDSIEVFPELLDFQKLQELSRGIGAAGSGTRNGADDEAIAVEEARNMLLRRPLREDETEGARIPDAWFLKPQKGAQRRLLDLREHAGMTHSGGDSSESSRKISESRRNRSSSIGDGLSGVKKPDTKAKRGRTLWDM